MWSSRRRPRARKQRLKRPSPDSRARPRAGRPLGTSPLRGCSRRGWYCGPAETRRRQTPRLGCPLQSLQTVMPFGFSEARTVELRNRERITISLLVFLIDPAVRFASARVCAGKNRKYSCRLSALTRRAKALVHQHAQVSSQQSSWQLRYREKRKRGGERTVVGCHAA